MLVSREIRGPAAGAMGTLARYRTPAADV